MLKWKAAERELAGIEASRQGGRRGQYPGDGNPGNIEWVAELVVSGINYVRVATRRYGVKGNSHFYAPPLSHRGGNSCTLLHAYTNALTHSGANPAVSVCLSLSLCVCLDLPPHPSSQTEEKTTQSQAEAAAAAVTAVAVEPGSHTFAVILT